MQAIVYRRYGPPEVLTVEEVEKPVPAENEVLLKVRAAALNPLDWHFLRGSPYGMRFMSGLAKPKIQSFGIDVAGEVEALGSGVMLFQPGDEVFGSCRGACAEFACTAETNLARKPANVSFEQAASVPVAAYTALQALRDKAHLQPGQKLLINGAAGGVGTFAVQIARWMGAQVTGVCSARNVDLVRSLGAHQVIDYAREDFTEGAQRYDVLLDCIGNHSIAASRRVLSRGGIYIMVGAPSGRWVAPMDRSIAMRMLAPFVSQKLVGILAHWSQSDLALMSDLMASGKVTPVIDRSYSLRQVPDAIRYLEGGHARGKVVIAV